MKEPHKTVFPVIVIGVALLGIFLLFISHYFLHQSLVLKTVQTPDGGTEWIAELSRIHWSAELIRSAGHAFIVAAVIAAAVDPFIKARLAKELSRSFLGYTIGWDIPKAFRERTEELLKTTAVIRKHFSIHYRLRINPDNPDSITVETSLEFEAENLTSKPQPFVLRHQFEEMDRATMLEMRCTSNHAESEYYQGHLVPQATLASGLQRFQQYFVKQVSLEPRERGYWYKFKYSFSFPKKIEDSDIFSFGSVPTSDVSIELDECPEEIEFVPDPGALRSAGILKRWTYDKAFFEGNHITVRWIRKTNQPISSSNVQT